ncbi:15691_t:CDS:2, partial [Gigaspora rosea]
MVALAVLPGPHTTGTRTIIDRTSRDLALLLIHKLYFVVESENSNDRPQKRNRRGGPVFDEVWDYVIRREKVNPGHYKAVCYHCGNVWQRENFVNLWDPNFQDREVIQFELFTEIAESNIEDDIDMGFNPKDL